MLLTLNNITKTSKSFSINCMSKFMKTKKKSTCMHISGAGLDTMSKSNKINNHYYKIGHLVVNQQDNSSLIISNSTLLFKNRKLRISRTPAIDSFQTGHYYFSRNSNDMPLDKDIIFINATTSSPKYPNSRYIIILQSLKSRK